MDSGTDFSFFISEQNKIFLLIGDVPVIITGPNSGADKQIEKNIVEQFCLQYDCREYFEKTHYVSDDSSFNKVSDDSSDKIKIHDISGEWLLKSNHLATFSISNGLIFNFNNIKDRKEKEHWAIRVSKELILLLDFLKRTQEKGKVISWSSLMIEQLPLTDNAYKVIINQNNDYIKVSLPLLGQRPVLFHLLIPWLKSYFENQPDYRMIINNADKYLIQR